MTTIGFLGAGRMGAALVTTRLKSGHKVHVWNRTAAKVQALAAFRARPEPTPKAVVAFEDDFAMRARYAVAR